jgi:hypothetical protein
MKSILLILCLSFKVSASGTYLLPPPVPEEVNEEKETEKEIKNSEDGMKKNKEVDDVKEPSKK